MFVLDLKKFKMDKPFENRRSRRETSYGSFVSTLLYVDSTITCECNIVELSLFWILTKIQNG